ncbi:MAG: AAA family ATPase [Nitrospirae bacterium]|nr:AAA family ATPase [Nitrospirota bacterium]MBF0534087.1 AAA family ATPase [Nitrospirota bacterium]MBF0616246.1 AAA family ATPase [Nitrospirota bacterium]
MGILFDLSAKIKNYKCFGEDEQGFDKIFPINIIIGRNNTGKSTLLELIERLTMEEANFPEEQWHGRQRPQVILEAPVTKGIVESCFGRVRAGAPVQHWHNGTVFIGKIIKWYLFNKGGTDKFIAIENSPGAGIPLANSLTVANNLANSMGNPLEGKIFQRIFAERNILPEEAKKDDLSVHSDGVGVTNIIQNFINKANLLRELVEKNLLTDLNAIVTPDAQFTDIVCQQLENDKWEIYLKEDKKGLVPLSHTGSGFKTIILVLVYIHLIPAVLKRKVKTKDFKLKDCIFAFEELENNLHPALLRKLLTYLTMKVDSEKFILFLTTHSNVAIDYFSKNPNAQIIHVTHDGQKTLCKTVETYIENKGILDDLDIRASDLLQSNGIIWVEGPSDRVYINKWISIWSEGTLQEGTHYQCVFYGGRLLAHLSAEEPDQVSDLVSIFRVNRNAVVLIDSDKKDDQASLNETKRRIIKEVEENEGIAWVTKGNEIENYIPAEAVGKLLNKTGIEQVEQFEDFFKYLDAIDVGEKSSYRKKKPVLAEKVCEHLTKENTKSIIDLDEKMTEVCSQIRKWNNM